VGKKERLTRARARRRCRTIAGPPRGSQPPSLSGPTRAAASAVLAKRQAGASRLNSLHFLHHTDTDTHVTCALTCHSSSWTTVTAPTAATTSVSSASASLRRRSLYGRPTFRPPAERGTPSLHCSSGTVIITRSMQAQRGQRHAGAASPASSGAGGCCAGACSNAISSEAGTSDALRRIIVIASP